MSKATKVTQPQKILTLKENYSYLNLLQHEEQTLLKGGNDYYYHSTCSCKEKRVRVRRYYWY